MNLEIHGTGYIFQFGIRVGGSIAQEFFHEVVKIGPLGVSHCSSDGSKGREHGIVKGPCLIEERADKFLDWILLCRGNYCSGSGVEKNMVFHVVGCVVAVWGMFWRVSGNMVEYGKWIFLSNFLC